MSFGFDPPDLLSGHRGRMLVLLTAGLTTAKFGKYVIPPLIPRIIEVLSITPFEAGLVLSVLSLFYALLQYPGGRASDDLTRRTVLAGGLSLLLAGLVVLAASPSYPLLLLGAALVGTGQGLYGPADRALLSDLFRQDRGWAFGVNVTGTELAGAIAAGVSAAALAVGVWRGAFLPGVLAAGTCALVLQRWSDEPVALSRVHLGARRTAARLFAGAEYRRLLLAYCLFAFVGNGAIGFLPTFLQAERGFSPGLATATFAAFFVVGVTAKPAAGWASDRGPRLSVAAAGLAVGGVGLSLLLAAPTAGAAVAGALLLGAGHRSFPPAVQAHLMDVFPDDSKGGDLGATRAVYIGVGSLGPAYVGFLAGRVGYAAAYATFLPALVLAVAVLPWRREPSED